MKIVATMVVRNEDVFLERAVRNITGFCDAIIINDHQSQDGTREIIRRLASEFPGIVQDEPIQHPRESHKFIEPYAGTDTWVIGVDGDEIYDPEGLKRFRQTLATGVLNHAWNVFGNVLNADSLDTATGEASGYLSPPCRSMTKLFHFGAISSWRGPCPQSLHGGELVFKPGFDSGKRVNLHMDLAWEDADFRCLHACFLKRSSIHPEGAEIARGSAMDLHHRPFAKAVRRIVDRLMGRPVYNYKIDKYRRGARVTKNVSTFFP